MEAMACGAALVTYDNGGCRDYARDGETALVAPRRDVEALAAALTRLAADAGAEGALAAAGAALRHDRVRLGPGGGAPGWTVPTNSRWC